MLFTLVHLFSLFFSTPEKAVHFSETDCLDILKNYTQKLVQLQSKSKKQAYYLHIAFHTIDKSSTNVLKDELIMSYASNTALYCQSKQYSLWSDTAFTVAVIAAKKEIIISKSNLRNIQAMQSQSSFWIQQQLLNNSVVSDCHDEKEGERSFKVIELVPNAAFQKLCPVKKAIYSFDLHTQMLYKADLIYLPSHPIKEQIAIYHELNFDYTHFDYAPAKSRIYNPDGSLKKQYSGYKIIGKP